MKLGITQENMSKLNETGKKNNRKTASETEFFFLSFDKKKNEKKTKTQRGSGKGVEATKFGKKKIKEHFNESERNVSSSFSSSFFFEHFKEFVFPISVVIFEVRMEGKTKKMGEKKKNSVTQ